MKLEDKYTLDRWALIVPNSAKVLLVGIIVLLGGLSADLIGQKYQTLIVLILSLGLSVAGAMLAVRGMIEFLSERLSNRANKQRGE